MKRKTRGAILLICTALLLVFCARFYLGYHYLGVYKKLRSEAPNIEREFPSLEAALKKAVPLFKNPLFLKELGRLYLERAFGENEFGTPEKRDFFFDLALGAFTRQAELNPADAWAYYELGKVWTLYNFPLLTYAEKGRSYFRASLEFNPANEFLNLNVLYTFLTEWNDLSGEEKAFTLSQTAVMAKNNAAFMGKLRRRWVENGGKEARLNAILAGNE